MILCESFLRFNNLCVKHRRNSKLDDINERLSPKVLNLPYLYPVIAG